MERKKLTSTERNMLEHKLYNLATKIDVYGMDGISYELSTFRAMTDSELRRQEERLTKRDVNITLIKEYSKIEDTFAILALLACDDKTLQEAADKIRTYYAQIKNKLYTGEYTMSEEDEAFIKTLYEYKIKEECKKIEKPVEELYDKEEFFEGTELEDAYGETDAEELNLRFGSNIRQTN